MDKADEKALQWHEAQKAKTGAKNVEKPAKKKK